jgi:chemotaxis protein methyltransferase CheR
LPEEWRRRYFEPAAPFLSAIASRLKKGIHWQIHDLATDEPPQKSFSLIFLRNNLLTYYQEKMKKAALTRMLGGLEPDGFLMIGSHEKLPVGMESWAPSGFHSSIYRKTSAYEV